MERLGADPASILVAPNGIDHDVYHARGRRPVGSGGPLHAVFVGRLIGNKGPVVALDAVAVARAAGRDVRLSVLGDGPMRSRLEERSTTLGLSGVVEFHGHVADVAHQLRGGDVLLRPSYTEGLPLAVLEAMACGLPVICSTVPGNTEVVRHDVNGCHTSPGAATQVADTLIALCDDRSRLRRLADGAVSTAAQYSWEKSAVVHASALRSVHRLIPPSTTSQEPVTA
jgi:glycosyltransferase involved in cell wall biosynthesis